MTEYKILAPNFKRRGWEYSLIKRDGMIAVYEQRNPCRLDKISGFAVVRIKTVKETKMPNGKIVPPREKFPSPSEFGRYGWYYMSKSKEIALEHFDRLVEKFVDNMPPKKTIFNSIGVITHIEHERGIDRVDGVIA
jgi:hypothetical protein